MRGKRKRALSENLFMFEFIVDKVQIYPRSLPREIADVEGETCVSVKLLNNEPLDICEADFRRQSDFDRPCEEMKNGKSCLLVLQPTVAKRATKELPLYIDIFRKYDMGLLPETLQIGQCTTPIQDVFRKIVKILEKKGNYNTNTLTNTGIKSTTIKGTVPGSGCCIGELTIFVRISCFGRILVNQFQMDLEANKSVNFEKKKPCRKPCSEGPSQCDPFCPGPVDSLANAKRCVSPCTLLQGDLSYLQSKKSVKFSASAPSNTLGCCNPGGCPGSDNCSDKECNPNPKECEPGCPGPDDCLFDFDFSNLSENLFLLEFLVERVKIYAKTLPEEIEELPGETSLSITFLDKGPLIVEESDYNPKTVTRDKMKNGKSCLLVIHPGTAKQAMGAFDIDFEVYKKFRAFLPDRLQIGVATVSIRDAFRKVMYLLKMRGSCKTISETVMKNCTIKGTIPCSACCIGEINIFIRMSCFGKLIITQFQMNAEKKSVYFKDREGKAMYKYYKVSRSGRRSQGNECDPTCPGPEECLEETDYASRPQTECDTRCPGMDICLSDEDYSPPAPSRKPCDDTCPGPDICLEDDNKDDLCLDEVESPPCSFPRPCPGPDPPFPCKMPPPCRMPPCKMPLPCKMPPPCRYPLPCGIPLPCRMPPPCGPSPCGPSPCGAPPCGPSPCGPSPCGPPPCRYPLPCGIPPPCPGILPCPRAPPCPGMPEICPGIPQPCPGVPHPCPGMPNQPCRKKIDPCPGMGPPCTTKPEPCAGMPKPCPGLSCSRFAPPCAGMPQP